MYPTHDPIYSREDSWHDAHVAVREGRLQPGYEPWFVRRAQVDAVRRAARAPWARGLLRTRTSSVDPAALAECRDLVGHFRARLTRRQWAIVRRVAAGDRLCRIASRLKVCVKTVARDLETVRRLARGAFPTDY